MNAGNAGCVVRNVRQSLGLTQDQFSRVTGIPRSSIAKYERGHAIPPGDVLLAIMRREFPVRRKRMR